MEWDQIQKEEEDIENLKRNGFLDDRSLKQLDTVTKEMQMKLLKTISDRILEYDAKELDIEREKAAEVIKKAFRKNIVFQLEMMSPNLMI